MARRALRLLLGATLILAGSAAIGLGGLGLHWQGDPTERIRARAGEVVRARPLEHETTERHELLEERLTSSSGLEVTVRTRRPIDGAAGPRRALLLVGGYETGRHAVDLVPDARGCIVASIDYPYEGGQLRKVRGRRVLMELGELRAALLDTPAALSLVRQHLAAQPDVDPTRIELVGASLGALMVCYAGGIDDGFARVWCLHGGGDVDRLTDLGLRRKIGFAPLRSAVCWLPRYAMGGEGPEAFAARIAPRPFVMINAKDDERFPRASVDALFEGAREPKALIWVEGVHVDPKRPDTIAALTDAMFERIEARPLLDAREPR